MFPRAPAPRVPSILAIIASCLAWSVSTSAVQPASARQERLVAATRHATEVCNEWLGAQTPSVSKVPAPLIDVPRTMAFEATVIHDAVTRCVLEAIGQRNDGGALRAGLAKYLHALATERLFDQRFQRRAYSQHAEQLFGGLISFPVRGIHRTRLTALRQSDTNASRVALAFMTLERRLGLPRLQGALRAAADGRGETGLMGRLEDALGQQVSWLFADAARGRVYDYALTHVDTDVATCGAVPCHRTQVVVRRGAGQYRGPLTLAVTFAGGAKAEASWDGDEETETIWFESPGPAEHASLDAGNVLVLDRNLLDDVFTLTPRTNVNVGRWMGQWSLWLQHVLLTHAYFF